MKNEKCTLLSTIHQKYLPIRQKDKIPHSPPLWQACIFTPPTSLIQCNPHTICAHNLIHESRQKCPIIDILSTTHEDGSSIVGRRCEWEEDHCSTSRVCLDGTAKLFFIRENHCMT